MRGIQGFRQVVVCKRRENRETYTWETVHAFEELGYLRRQLERIARKVLSRRLWPVYRSWLRSTGTVLVHAHFGPVGWEIAADCDTLGIPLVTSFYGYDAGQLARNPVWQARYHDLFESGSLFLAEGPHLASTLEGLGCPREKIRVQRLGIDPGAFPVRPPATGGARSLLFAGTFREKKGLPEAIEVLARAIDRCPELTLDVVGGATTPEEASQEAIAKELVEKHGLQGKVKFRGYLDRRAFIEALRNSDILLAPSLTARDGDSEGGAPVTLIQAQAVGLPVVSTQHCDIPYVIENGGSGLLVAEHDVEGMADAIVRLSAEHALRQSFAERGRANVAARFDQRILCAELSETYWNVIEAA